jgi:hypothetical protein
MSRLWARRIASEVAREGLELVCGGDALAGQPLRDFEQRIGLAQIHDGWSGNLLDLGQVAQAVHIAN